MNQNQYTSNSGLLTFAYPEHWSITDEDGCVTACDPENGVGAFVMSVYEAPEAQDPTELLFEYLSDNKVIAEEGTAQYYESQGNRVAVSSYFRDEYFNKVWFIAKATAVLLATYNCKGQNCEPELRTVE